MRIDSLTYNNIQTQGERRRVWLRQHSPRHLEQSNALIMRAFQLRQPGASRSTLVLGAGACTEVPLEDLARASDEVVLADLDLASMQKARAGLSSTALRKRVRLLQSDLTGGVSANLNKLIERQPWEVLIPQGDLSQTRLANAASAASASHSGETQGEAQTRLANAASAASASYSGETQGEAQTRLANAASAASASHSGETQGEAQTRLANAASAASASYSGETQGEAVFAAAARCIEECQVPDPPEISGLGTHEFGVVISSLVLTQLFSYPLLDVLDLVRRLAPGLLEEQERHHRYQKAAQEFRVRVLQAHLHLLRELVDSGGIVVLLSDVRGFVFEKYDPETIPAQRRTMPLVPRTFPELVRAVFPVREEAHWEWLTDLPEKNKPGRGYEVVGYVLG